jgi:hypothetical protein
MKGLIHYISDYIFHYMLLHQSLHAIHTILQALYIKHYIINYTNHYIIFYIQITCSLPQNYTKACNTLHVSLHYS